MHFINVTNQNDTGNKKIRVKIITDRLFRQADALADYFRHTGNIEVVGLAETKQQALSIAQEHDFDYLIIAGYLTEYNYNVIAELQKKQKKFIPVQWAILDFLIAGFCRRYKIPLKFDRTLPMSDFTDFLIAHKNDPASYYKESQPGQLL